MSPDVRRPYSSDLYLLISHKLDALSHSKRRLFIGVISLIWWSYQMMRRVSIIGMAGKNEPSRCVSGIFFSSGLAWNVHQSLIFICFLESRHGRDAICRLVTCDAMANPLKAFTISSFDLGKSHRRGTNDEKMTSKKKAKKKKKEQDSLSLIRFDGHIRMLCSPWVNIFFSSVSFHFISSTAASVAHSHK